MCITSKNWNLPWMPMPDCFWSFLFESFHLQIAFKYTMSDFFSNFLFESFQWRFFFCFPPSLFESFHLRFFFIPSPSYHHFPPDREACPPRSLSCWWVASIVLAKPSKCEEGMLHFAGAVMFCCIQHFESRLANNLWHKHIELLPFSSENLQNDRTLLSPRWSHITAETSFGFNCVIEILSCHVLNSQMMWVHILWIFDIGREMHTYSLSTQAAFIMDRIRWLVRL